jgi:hypothetical protein
VSGFSATRAAYLSSTSGTGVGVGAAVSSVVGAGVGTAVGDGVTETSSEICSSTLVLKILPDEMVSKAGNTANQDDGADNQYGFSEFFFHAIIIIGDGLQCNILYLAPCNFITPLFILFVSDKTKMVAFMRDSYYN